jgi:hypothetical protein
MERPAKKHIASFGSKLKQTKVRCRNEEIGAGHVQARLAGQSLTATGPAEVVGIVMYIPALVGGDGLEPPTLSV